MFLTCMILPRTQPPDTAGGVSVTTDAACLLQVLCWTSVWSDVWMCCLCCVVVSVLTCVCLVCGVWLLTNVTVKGGSVIYDLSHFYSMFTCQLQDIHTTIYKVMSVLKILSGGLLQYLMWLLPKLYSIQPCTLMWDSCWIKLHIFFPFFHFYCENVQNDSWKSYEARSVQ